MNKYLKAGVKIVTGIAMLAAALAGYLPTPELLVEFSFISNAMGGVLLILDGMESFRGKKMPEILHRNICVGLFFVFTVCMGSLSGAYRMNFQGAFFILHVVAPILFCILYVFLCDDSRGSVWKKLFAAPILVMVWLLFDFILGKVRGSFVYGLLEPEEIGFMKAMGIGAVAYIAAFAVGAVFLFLNRAVHKREV